VTLTNNINANIVTIMYIKLATSFPVASKFDLLRIL